MKFTHFYVVPFTGLGLHNGFRGNHWLKNRIKVFKEYVIPSLLAKKGEFYVWICWREEEKENQLVKELAEFLNKTSLNVVHTFGGIPFYDDKYEDSVARKRILDTLKISLPELKDMVQEDLVLLTIQPSDDVYFETSTKDIQDMMEYVLRSNPSTKQAVGWLQGYIMNYTNKEIAEYIRTGWRQDETSTYHTDTIPPFFTILFGKEQFLDPEKHFNHIGPYKSHEYIADHLDFTPLEGRGFIVGTHGENISTTYNHRYKGRILEGKEREGVLRGAGILHSKPIKMKLSPRVRLRQAVNRLPFRNMVKWLYNNLPAKFRII